MTRNLLRFAAAVLLIASCAFAQAQPVAGRNYQELRPPHPVSTGARIEVIEFFYYGCPVCYETQPHLAKWLFTRGADVGMVRIPAVAASSWDSFARTYYTLEAMGQLARLHWPVYDNHHFDNRKLDEEKNLLEWVAANGVDANKFRAIWNSAETKAKVEAAKKTLISYEVTGVPAFVVDGKYLTSARMAGGTKQLVEVVDYLVERARAERPKP